MDDKAIEATLLGHQLMSIVDEMTMATVRAAYSPNIHERFDCGSAVIDLDGQILAQTDHTPLHLGAMRGLVLGILDQFGGHEIRPGDIFVGNDPFQAGTVHLNDVSVASPLHVGSDVVAFVANTAHHADIGGRVPGGEAFNNESILEEGLRIPIIRIFDRGEVQEPLLRMIAMNSRNAREVMGDLRAQFAACRLGVRRMREVCDRRGYPAFLESCQTLLAASELRFRSQLEEVPDGEYSFVDHIDSDWAGSDPLPIKATLRVNGSDLTVDLRENPDVVVSGRNVPYAMLEATVLFAVKAAIDPWLLPNSGYFRAVTILSNPGSLVHAVSPAAVSVGPWTCARVADALFGAFAQIDPEGLSAGSTTPYGWQIGGWDSRRDRYFLNYERFGGGFGARSTKDGLDGVQAGITNTSNLPIEVLEHDYPLLVLQYGLAPDSGGPGKYRGGLGIRRDVQVLAEEARLSAQGERFVVPTWGLDGGQSGRLGSARLNPGTDEERPLDPAFADMLLREGDVISIRTPGGGGYGEERRVGKSVQDV